MLLATACFALIAAVSATTATSGTDGAAASKPPAQKPATAAAWKSIIAKAKAEGSVTLYSSQDPNNLAKFAARFKELFGVTLNFYRNNDSITVAQVTAEHGTGKAVADMWISAARPHVLGAVRNGWVVSAVGPNLFYKRYDRAKFAKPGKAFNVGTSTLGIGWNTRLYPQGVKDYPDFLNPALAGGRIGVLQPTSPAIVDYYQYMEKVYGKSFVTRLAAQKPQVYQSALPMLQAMAAGEISAGTLIPGTSIDLKAQGAPVDFAIPTGSAWNAPYWGMVLKQAPHPNAAQLLANFMLSPEGQGLVARRYGSVLKGIQDTFFVPFHQQILLDLQPAKVAAYQQYWASLFLKK
jgi:iron(III) transport system substrate-binding protein